MKFVILTTLTLLTITGCSNEMTTKEIVAAIKECKDNNLTVYSFRNGFSRAGSTTVIFCQIKETK